MDCYLGKLVDFQSRDTFLYDSCNTINNHFCAAGEHLALATDIIATHGYEVEDIDNLYPQHANNNWTFQEVDSNDVVSAIDKVPISLVKTASVALASLIAFCINVAIRISFFPDELLKGRLKLIHKSGDSDIENFRGLTLLPAVSKIFEFLLAEQLIAYLNSLKFFAGNQFGFIRNSSCIGGTSSD